MQTSSSKPVIVNPEMLEVVDSSNKPFAILPRQELHRQNLYHRAVLITVFNDQFKLFIQKRHRKKKLYPGRWDVSASGHVQAGESIIDAARREVLEELGYTPKTMSVRHTVKANAETGFEFVTLLSAGKTHTRFMLNREEVEDGMFVDQNELRAMLNEYPEMLTPGLLYFGKKNLLFPRRIS